jgi:hypothetical protein
MQEGVILILVAGYTVNGYIPLLGLYSDSTSLTTHQLSKPILQRGVHRGGT